MTVFDTFRCISYDFLEVSRGTVYGLRVKSETEGLLGVFKLRAASQDAMQGMELQTSSATLHVKPEDFTDWDINDLIGQGVRVQGVEYQIEAATAGTNFDSGIVEHITLTLQRASYAA